MSRDLAIRPASLARLRAGRAVATARQLEADTNHVVHEQLARLHFVSSRWEHAGQSILDFGCGAGYVLDYFARTGAPAELVGIDCDPAIVEFARAHYPDIHFSVHDAARPGLELGRRFDAVLSFEVLEHVEDQSAYVDNMLRHVRPGGLVVVSTPNRTVFSLGERVSVHNPTHRRELDCQEFEGLLAPLVPGVAIHGQRFRAPSLQRSYVTATRHLVRRQRLRERLEAGLAPTSPVLRLFYRLEQYHDRIRVRTSPIQRTRWHDFEFTRCGLERCIWLVAVGRKP